MAIILYHNNGDDHYRYNPPRGGRVGARLGFRIEVWFDYDNDGRLDPSSISHRIEKRRNGFFAAIFKTGGLYCICGSTIDALSGCFITMATGPLPMSATTPGIAQHRGKAWGVVANIGKGPRHCYENRPAGHRIVDPQEYSSSAHPFFGIPGEICFLLEKSHKPTERSRPWLLQTTLERPSPPAPHG